MQFFLLIINTVISVCLVVACLYLHQMMSDIKETAEKILDNSKLNIEFNQVNSSIKDSGIKNVDIYRASLDALRSYNPLVESEKAPQEIILGTRAQCQEVINQLNNRLNRYGVIMLSDLYDLVDLTSNYEDSKFGWTSLSSAKIERHKLGWQLILPNAKSLSSKSNIKAGVENDKH